MTRVLIRATLWLCFFASLLMSHSARLLAVETTAADFIEFYTQWDFDCEERGGERVFVKNTHASEIIDLHIDRYFEDVRQPGRSMFALLPDTDQALGCNVVFDAEQRWQLIAAHYISSGKAAERYGLAQ